MAWCGTKKAKKLLSLDKSSIIVFDLETTDRFPNSAEILQISIVDGNGNDLFSSYVKPNHKRKWPNAEKVNGISPERVENEPRFSEIRNQVQEYFNQAKLIAGYNIKSYDIPILERYGIAVPLNRFDVMEEFRQYTGRVAGYRLQDCAKYFGYSFIPHDATADASITARCMQALISSEGFVNYDPPKSRKTTEEQLQDVEESKEQLPLRVRLMKPFLKKRGFRSLILSFILMAACFCWIYYHTYGTDVSTIEINQLINTVLINKENLVICIVFLIGFASFTYGFVNLIARTIQWIFNLIRNLISNLFQ